jgi:ribosomal protein S27E
VDTFFNTILKPEDEIMVIINDKTVIFRHPLKNKKLHLDILKGILRDQARIAGYSLMGYLNRVKLGWSERNIKELMTRDSSFNATKVINFLDKYLEEWHFFKKEYLIPDTRKYYNFAHHLQKIHKKKWVINFYQLELFPKLKLSGNIRQEIDIMTGTLEVSRSEDSLHARLIKDRLNQINKELNIVSEFPVQELSKLFYKVNTSFHSIFMNISKETGTEDFAFQRVSSDLENCFREITKSTGGKLTLSGNISSALHQISEQEDNYYILSYTPKNSKNIGKIKIEMKNEKHKAFYDNNQRKDYINDFIRQQRKHSPTIRLGDLMFKEDNLTFSITNFHKLTKKIRKKKAKHILVRIKIYDEADKNIYNKLKTIDPQKEKVSVNVLFDWLETGQYYITVDVWDQVSNKSDMDSIYINISQ